MKSKYLYIILSSFFLFIAYWLISPLFFDKKVEEKLEDSGLIQEGDSALEKKITTAFRGSFMGLANHEAGGEVEVLNKDGVNVLRFQENFKSTNGPDVRVYLGKDGKYDPKADLGEIKGNIGSQNYEIPSSINLADYNEVWIWCRAFSVPFGKADLVSIEKAQ